MDELREALDRAAGPQTGVDIERVRQRRDERHRRRRIAAFAAAVAMVLAAGVGAVVSKNRSADGGVVVAGEPDEERSTPGYEPNPIDWRTPNVHLEAADFAIEVKGMEFTGHDPDLDLGGDTGTPEEYTTFEAMWHEHGVEMRLNIYLRSDGVEWWSENIRIYNGEPSGEWIEFFGDFFRSPLAQPYQGDLALTDPATGGSLTLHDLTLRAFLPPPVCAPGALHTVDVLYPDLDVPVGTTQQVGVRLLGADCEPVAFPNVRYTWTTDDSMVVGLDPRCLGRTDGPNSCSHPVANVTGQHPGRTVLSIDAVNSNGDVVAEASMNVRVVGEPAPGPDSADEAEDVRLTPLPTALPDLPPTHELERRAATVPGERRQLFGTNDDGTITGWANPEDRPASAFPIFGFDDKLIGVYVSGLGIIDRAQYDAPDFDPEAAAHTKWGEEEYDRRLVALREAQQRAGELQAGPEGP